MFRQEHEMKSTLGILALLAAMSSGVSFAMDPLVQFGLTEDPAIYRRLPAPKPSRYTPARKSAIDEPVIYNCSNGKTLRIGDNGYAYMDGVKYKFRSGLTSEPLKHRITLNGRTTLTCTMSSPFKYEWGSPGGAETKSERQVVTPWTYGLCFSAPNCSGKWDLAAFGQCSGRSWQNHRSTPCHNK